MFTYLALSFKRRWFTYLLLGAILLVLGTGYGGTQVLTQGIVMTAQKDLEDHWRWQYDILVYPKEAQEYQGLGDGWVAPQTSLATYGGISMEDLEIIRQIPGVEVAAPLSLLGYFEHFPETLEYKGGQRGEYYEILHEKTAFDGLRDIRLSSIKRYMEYAAGGQDNQYSFSQSIVYTDDGIELVSGTIAPGVQIRSGNEMMVVAVDPEAEDRLYGLSDAVVEGEDLLQAQVTRDRSTSDPLIPLIFIKDKGLQVEEYISISRFEVPEGTDFGEFLDEAVVPKLETFPKSPLTHITINSYSPELRYEQVRLSFDQNGILDKQHYPYSLSNRYQIRYSPLQFHIQSTKENGIPVLYVEEKERPKSYYLGEQDTTYLYRELIDDHNLINVWDLKIGPDSEQVPRFGYLLHGYYDASLIVPQYASSWQIGDPADFYTPQHSMILGDGAGNLLEPRPLIPLPFKDAYYSGAPDAITTLKAASIIYGDDPPISSIRVVVNGVQERSEESQKRIEQVASEIVEQTGHNVEIMLGSSAGKVHIQLAGAGEGEIGLVEEGWQQKGVSWEIEEQISAANQWLFFYLGVIIFILSYTVITHSLLKRSTEFSMLRAVGWSRGKIIAVLSIEIALLSTIPIIPLFLVKRVWGFSLAWQDGLLLVLLNLVIIVIGYYSGSRRSVWLSPRAGLAGEGRGGTKRLFPIQGVLGYVLHQLLRRPLRFGLMILSLVLSTVMVLLFVATQQSLSDFLFLSFLGEIVDLQLKSYQFSFLIFGIFFTVAVVVMLLLLNMMERKKELYVMRSIGWSLQKVRGYLLLESGVIGMVGGILGTIAGYAMLTYFSSLWLPAWVSVLAIVFPFLLLILFTWILYRFFVGSHSLRKTMD